MAPSLRLVLILTACVHIADGELRFASYYGDHMVLQKSPAKAVLWGYGPEGANITVYLSGPKQYKTSPVVVEKGIWRVSLEPVEAGGPYNVTVASHHDRAALTDVLFGDVWLCGGQSNMFFKTSQIFNASEELKLAADFPHVRPFTVALKYSDTPLTDLMAVQLPWSVPTAENVAGFSAVCWLFGRYLYETLRYPIGLVESCWGGTPVEAWSSPTALQQCGLEEQTTVPKLMPGIFKQQLAAATSFFLNLGKPHDETPLTLAPQQHNFVLWNVMIHPLLSMTIKGAIWYQGEENADYHRDKYNCSFPAMIDDWRMKFHQGSGGQTEDDFPFGFVQLCTFTKNSTFEGFPEIRWHQTADFGFVPNQRMKKTFMAVSLDLPDETSPYNPLHPRDKQDVAQRLTLGARAVAYEKNVTFLGPFPKHVMLNATEVIIFYDQALSVTLSNHTFEICCSKTQSCGSNSSWVTVPNMQLSATEVRLFPAVCPPSEEVTGLRYAWRDWPCDFKACPVYSADRTLPAPPFITHRYKGEEIMWEEKLQEDLIKNKPICSNSM